MRDEQGEGLGWRAEEARAEGALEMFLQRMGWGQREPTGKARAAVPTDILASS